MDDLISRKDAIDALDTIESEVEDGEGFRYAKWREYFENLPSAQPEQHEIGYSECANAMSKMWMDDVLTNGEYNRIMDKLDAHWAERREE